MDPRSILRTALAHSARAYSESLLSSSAVATKDSKLRDVVGPSDTHVDEVVCRYLLSQGISVLSEESSNLENPAEFLAVLDPLDGSSNQLLGIPEFGTILGITSREGLVTGGIALHSMGITVIEADGRLQFSRRPTAPSSNVVGPAFLAYGSEVNELEGTSVRTLVLSDPTIFPGFHRIGSVAAGAVRFLLGQYSSFICIGVRLWDALGILPLLSTRRDVELLYSIDRGRISVICVGRDLPYASILLNDSLCQSRFDPKLLTSDTILNSLSELE